MRYFLRYLLAYLFILTITLARSQFIYSQTKPNIVVILTDDQGYADISFNPHHPDEVHTPHMDSLANVDLLN